MRRAASRLGVYGDVWLRLLTLGVRMTPWFLEPVFIALYSLLFFIAAAPARSALIANLRVLSPESGPVTRLLKAYQVIWSFAWSLVDAARTRSGQQVLDWEIHGLQHLHSLASHPGGAIILTAHMGNYDLAGPLFASRLQRRLHLVRAPERHAHSQAYASRQRDHLDPDWSVTHYNEPGNLLAVTLATLLKDGEIVAIQGDRILFDVAGLDLPFSATHDWRLPKGPFLLGLVARAPLFPVFITRVGWRCYAITAHAPWEWPEGRLDKVAAQQQSAHWWSALLARTIRQHASQWFVFEPAFDARPASTSTATETPTNTVVAKARPPAPCVTALCSVLAYLVRQRRRNPDQPSPDTLFLPASNRQSPLEVMTVSWLLSLASLAATALLIHQHWPAARPSPWVTASLTLPVWLLSLHALVLAPVIVITLLGRHVADSTTLTRLTTAVFLTALLATFFTLAESPMPTAQLLGGAGIVLMMAETALRLLQSAIRLARPSR